MSSEDDIQSMFSNGLNLSDEEVLNTSTKQSKKRELCLDCNRPKEKACLCESLPKQKYELKRTKIVMLQHPFEVKRPMATEPIMRKVINTNNLECLNYIETLEDPESSPYIFIPCKLYKPHKYKKLSEYLENNKQNVKVLFPTEEAECLDGKIENNTNSISILIVLDGTWRQAKYMYQNSPFLHQFQHVIVKNNKISDYLIRTQPTEASLCTLEAVCLALIYLGEDDELEENLKKPLKKLCEIQIGFGAVAHKSKQYNLANGLIENDLLPKSCNRKINKQKRLIDEYNKINNVVPESS